MQQMKQLLPQTSKGNHYFFKGMDVRALALTLVLVLYVVTLLTSLGIGVRLKIISNINSRMTLL